MSELMKFDPFRGLVRMQRDMDRLFESFFGRPLLRTEEDGSVRVPSVDVQETENEVLVSAELPGVTKDNLEVEVLPEQLTLKAEVNQEDEKEEGTYHFKERIWSRFERTLPLPVEVVPDQVKASLKDGVLQVRLPKSERAKAQTPRKVKVD